ncbi:MAG TPA: hypothetical protein VFS83_18145 [Ktedonobacterales bacterium]|nr:hypothetical protein [Ktedonobacterales bacterium]
MRRLKRLKRITPLAGICLFVCLLVWLLAWVLVGCAPTTSVTPVMSVTPSASAPSGGCVPTDQDRYVYQPTRLQVLRACVHITGIVREIERDGVDGDITLLIQLDPPYESLLTARNQEAQHGYLVVEPVCMLQPLLPGAISLCASDPAPYAGPIPSIGAHVWMDGRYVLDLNHGAWAELHPLYRAGLLTP